MPSIIHLVPQLPPVVSGVADYAVLVGHKIEEQQPEIRCGYIACGYQTAGDGAGRFRRNATGSCDATQLWRAVHEISQEFNGDIDKLALVVHYSGYGYDQAGAPGWLADALERRPPQFAAVRIVSMFHELYATAWPWRRAFWYSVRQRGVATRIARISHALITNREQSARWLEQVTGRAAGSVGSLPIPSNVGEPCEVVRWDARASQAVTFGGAAFKRPFLVGRGAQATAALCRKLEIGTLLCIGVPVEIDERAFQSNGIDVIQTGFLDAAEVSARFRGARLSLVDYFHGYYSKSSVLAAAAAHGTPPIFPRHREASDGLRFGEHLWDIQSAHAAGSQEACARLSAMSQAISAWYAGHSIAQHARRLGEACCVRQICWADLN